MEKSVVIDWLSKNEPGNKKLIRWVKSKTFEHEKGFIALSKKRLSESFIREFESRVDWYGFLSIKSCLKTL